MTPKVAFSVRLTEDTSLDEAPLIFDMVDLNIGEGYDKFSGLLHAHKFLADKSLKF